MHTYWKDGEFALAVEPVEVTGDAVGAGDVADAGFIAGMLLRRAPEDCTRMAHACAVHSLAGNGRDSYPDKELLLGALGGGRS
jgi:sugar/nucleoside kinase (ribokinase family)